MDIQELLRLLEAGNVTIHTPESFSFKEVFNDMDTSMSPGMREFVSLDNPNVTMTFDTDFHDSGEPYCSVFATDENGDHMLLSEDERGNVIGHMNEVESFINNHFDEGFYESQEAESKIDGWNDLVNPPDADYERYLEQLAMEEKERMEVEGGDAYEVPMVDDSEPPTLEELNEINPPDEDLSGLSFEEQSAWIEEALQPGGKIDQMIEEIKLGERPSPQEKFEMAGNDRVVSDATKEYFTPSAEKQPYFEIMKTGFIPFEIREGYHGKDAAPDEIKIPNEVVNDIRMNVDPEFGYIAGVDTSKFHMRNEDGELKNVAIIPMTYDDLKPYMTETNLFEEKDVVSVRAIKEFGDTMPVQGERFAVNNLVTFEVKLENQEVHRSTMVIDDTGTALARMDFLATDLYHSFHIDTNNPYIGGDDLRLIHFEKLDRTNVDNPGHFKCMDGKDEAFREKFKMEIEDRIPGFLQDFCDKYEGRLESDRFDTVDRKDYMEMRLEDISDTHSSLHNLTNITELYRESLEAKAYAANKRAGELDNEINLIDTERKGVPKDSEKYKELSDKIETCKEKWAEAYSEYKDYKQQYETFSEDSASIRETYIDLNRQYENLSKEYEQHFNNLDSNGISYEEPGIERTPQEQFTRLCDITVLRSDQVPTYLSVDVKEIAAEKSDVITEAANGLQDIVDAYNEDIENPIEQIQYLGEDRDPDSISESNLYTASGYEIQAHSMTTDINRYLANNPDKNLETPKDTAIGEPHRPYIELSGHVDETNSELYAKEKAEGSDKTRQEIREEFIDKAIYDGNKPESVTLTDRSTSEGMTDTGLYHEMEAMKLTIDAHPGVAVSDIEGFREEVLERKAELDERIPKTEKDEFAQADSVEQNQSTDDADTKDEKKDNFDNRIARSIHGARGAVDVEKKAEISAEKLKELKVEAEQEAKETGRDKEEIFKEKREDLQYKLEKVAGDISHFKEKMESYGYVQSRFLGQHCGFQAAKAEFDSAIRLYEAIGGKVGEGAFVTKGVDSMGLFLSKMEFYGSNLASTMVLDRFADVDTVSNIRDLFTGADGREVNMYGGGLSKFMQNAVGIGSVIQTPAVFITQTIMRVMNWTPDDIAKMMDKPYFQREKDVEPDAPQDVSKEEKDTDTDGLKPDMEKQPDETVTSDETLNDVDTKEQPDEMVPSDVDVEEQDVDIPYSDEAARDADESLDEKDSADKLQDDVENQEEDADPAEQPEEEEYKSEVERAEDDKEDDAKVEAAVASEDRRNEDDNKDFKEDMERPEENGTEKEEIDSVEKEEADDADKDESDDVDKDELDDTDKEESDDPADSAKDEIEQNVNEDPDTVGDISEENLESDDTAREMEDSVEQISETDMEQAEEDSTPEDTGVEAENDKTDAVVMEGSMDLLETPDETEDITEEDIVKTEHSEEAEELPEEEEEPAFAEEIPETNEETEITTMADRIEDAVNGEEELDTVLGQVADDIVDGVEPQEAMDAILEGLTSALENGADAESVGDVVYEASNMLGDSPIETMDSMLEALAEHGVDPDTIDAIQEHVADIYDSVESPFEDTAYGELDGIEFFEEDTVDAASGDVDFDISYGTLDMFDSLMDTTDFDMMEADVEFVDHAEDMQADLESQGFPNDIAVDTAADMYEQMANDYDSGMDVFDDAYMEQLENQSLNSAQNTLENLTDINYEMDHMDNGFESNPMDNGFEQYQPNVDYTSDDAAMNQMQQEDLNNFNDFDNTGGFLIE